MRKGFVDLQVNGYLGIDFSAPDLTLDKIRFITEELVKRGTIGYCPTIVTSSFEIYRKNLPLIAEAMEKPGLSPHILGIHLEGPFISPEEGPRGAHSEKFIIPPDIKKYKRFQEFANGEIAIVTLAPELKGADRLIEYIAGEDGVVVSIGHHNADHEAIKKACGLGATCATHIGNGISDLLHRHKNPIWAELAEDAITGMFITDGNHIPDEFIKVALRAKTPEGFIVTSDSISLAGMKPGEYEIKGKKVVLEKDGRIKIIGTKYLAGSSRNMLQCMNKLASLGLLGEDELWEAGFSNPLKLIKRKLVEKDYGKLADLEFKSNIFSKGEES